MESTKALIAALASVERSGAGLRNDINLGIGGDISYKQDKTGNDVPLGIPKGNAPEGRRAIPRTSTAAAVTSSKVPPRQGVDHSLLDSSRFEKEVDMELWPPHIRDYKNMFEILERDNLKLPVLRQLSPRSKRKLEHMPAASALDITKANKYEKMAMSANPANIYHPPKAKKRISSAAPVKLKKLPTLSASQSNVVESGALRLPETAPPFSQTNSYFARFDEYRLKVAQKAAYAAAAEEVREARAEEVSSPVSKAPLRNFQYPADSKLLDMLVSNSKSPPSSSQDKSLYKTSSLKTDYAPVMKEAVGIGEALAKRQLELDKQLQKSQTKLSADTKNKFMDKWRGSLYDEIGLDVDPEFNKRRVYGDAWNALAYYINMCRTRAALELLRLQTKRTTAGIRSNAGAFLNRILWGHQARSRVRTLRRNLQLQRDAQILHEKVEARFVFYMQMKIATAIKAYCKRIKAALLQLQMENATKIQSHLRRIHAFQYVGRVRKYFRLRQQSSITIQAAYRRHAATRLLIFMRKYDRVQKWETYIELKNRERALRHRQHGASYIICRYIKAYLMQKRLHTLLYWHHFEVAIKLQRLVRGYLARVKCRRQIARFRKMIKLKIKRITILQSLWRGKVGRRKAAKVRGKKDAMQAERRRRKSERLAAATESSKLPRLTRKYLRMLHPFRYLFEHKRATTIQRIWRGHRGRRRKALVAAMARVRAYFTRIASRRSGARDIQRVFRGYVIRKKFLVRRRFLMAIKIQTQCRMYLAKKKVCHRRIYVQTSSLLYSMVSRLYLCRKYRLLFMHNMRLRVPIRIVQRIARQYIARMRRRAHKDILRFMADKKSSEALGTYRSLGCAQLELIYESIHRPIGKKAVDETRSLCGREARCLGPVQALFTHSITPGKALFDNYSLPNNRIDSTASLKLLQKINGIYAGKGVASGKLKKTNTATVSLGTSPAKKKKKEKLSEELVYSLSECFKREIILLPTKVKKVLQSDVDVAFNKAKSSGGSVLTYENFCSFMQAIAIAVNDKVPNQSIRDEKDENTDIIAPMKAGGTHPFLFPYHDLLTDRSTYSVGLIGAALGDILQIYLSNKPKSIATNGGPTATGTISVAKIAADARESWIVDVVQWLEDESRARVGSLVARIQRMVRRFRSKHILAHAKMEIYRSTAKERLLNAHVKAQAVVRRFLTRMKVVKIAQLLLVRYVPHSGPLYWHNPNTNVSTWAKPKILKGYDCVSIALPPPLLEYSIKCSNCLKITAEVNCLNCGDSFCRNCFDSLHCKGKRQTHIFEKIPMCCRCHYQCATKNCSTCTLRRPERGSIEELVRGKRNFGNYCDTCFTHIHDAVEKGHTSSVMNRAVANDLESGAIKDAYLVGHALHQRVITNHKFGNLVQACEECQWRSAAWRCIDCDQVYCSKCLQGMHSIGGPFTKHSAEKLPYYPPSLHQQTLKDSLAMRIADKIERIQRAFLKHREQERLVYCVILQTWWRMIHHGRLGRAYMKQQRVMLRRAHRVRKYEDLHMRSELSYKVRDVFGAAPHLKSDTKEERILKRFNVFRRQDIRRFIYQNRSDKYYVIKELAKQKAKKEAEANETEEGNEERGNAQSAKKPQFLKIRLPAAYLLRPKSRQSNKENGEVLNAPPGSRPTTAEMLAKNSKIKGTAQVAFDCGTEAELMDQATRGGWRMPGHINMVCGQKKHQTSMDLRPLLRRGEYARVQKQLFIVAEVNSNSVTFNRVWRQADMKKLLVYRLPSYADDKWLKYYEMKYKSFDALTGNAVAQTVLEWQERSMGRVAALLTERTKLHKKRGNMSGSQFWGRKTLKLQRLKNIATNLLADEIAVGTVKEFNNPYGVGFYGEDAEFEDDNIEEEIDDETRAKMTRTIGKRWEATTREKMERSRMEKVLTREELSPDAEFWEEHLDPMTNQTYYQDKETWEFMHTIPKCVEAKKALEQEAIDREKSYESAKLSAKSSLSQKRSGRM